MTPASGERTVEQALAGAGSIAAASEAVVSFLVDRGVPLPSLYLERGGRLRCMAMHGYWQVHDGFPPGIGVIGATYARGEAIQTAPAESSEYIAAAPDVESEICVPILQGGRPIGAINVEAPGPLPAGTAELLRDCAAAFVARLEQLGGIPPEPPSARLARHATRLSELTEVADIQRATLEAATDLVGMSSAMIVRFDTPDGKPAAGAACGPLGPALTGMGPEGFETIGTWVQSGTSCYTKGEPTGTGFVGHEFLRDAEVHAVIVTSLSARGEMLGLLVAADAEPTLPQTGDVEQLELLARQAAASLLTAAAMGELRERAARDPLTGLGHSKTFSAALRQARENTDGGVAVLMIDIDGFKAINDTLGHLVGDEIIIEISQTLSEALREGDVLYRVGGDEFATVLVVNGVGDAMAIAQRLCDAAAAACRATVSIGVALSDPAEADPQVLQRADAALYAAKDAGRADVRLAGPGQA